MNDVSNQFIANKQLTFISDHYTNLKKDAFFGRKLIPQEMLTVIYYNKWSLRLTGFGKTVYHTYYHQAVLGKYNGKLKSKHLVTIAKNMSEPYFISPKGDIVVYDLTEAALLILYDFNLDDFFSINN